MQKTRASDGTCNLCGQIIRRIRNDKRPRMSRSVLARILQLDGMNVEYYSLLRLEMGRRFVTDIDLFALAKVLEVDYTDLLPAARPDKL